MDYYIFILELLWNLPCSRMEVRIWQVATILRKPWIVLACQRILKISGDPVFSMYCNPGYVCKNGNKL